MMRIGLVHATINSVKPILDCFREDYPEIELVNVMDESLIYELNDTNQVTKDMVRRLLDLTSKLEKVNVDGILFTCSSFSPYIPLLKNFFDVPVLSSDEAMIIHAIDKGKNIAVIATVKKAAPTTKELLYNKAQELQKQINVTTTLMIDAFSALQLGDVKAHNSIIHKKINELINDYDSIILAQYSMAQVLASYKHSNKNKVISAPKLAVDYIVKLSKEYKEIKK